MTCAFTCYVFVRSELLLLLGKLLPTNAARISDYYYYHHHKHLGIPKGESLMICSLCNNAALTLTAWARSGLRDSDIVS